MSNDPYYSEALYNSFLETMILYYMEENPSCTRQQAHDIAVEEAYVATIDAIATLISDLNLIEVCTYE